MSFTINKFLRPFILIACIVSLLASCNKELPEAVPIQTPATTGPSITTVLNDPDYSILKAAIAKAAPAASSGLVPLSALFSDTTAVFTFFAPNNAAFQNAGIPSAAALAALSAGRLDTLLRYHLVGGQRLTSSVIPTSFPNIQMPTSLVLAPPSAALPPGLRMSIFPSKRGSTIWVNNIPVLTSDIQSSNGIVHKVALVVAPPSQFLWERIDTAADLTYLKAAIKRADEGVAAANKLEAALMNPAANLTVFAPVDAAFKALLTGLITQELMKQPGMTLATATATATALASSPTVFTNPALASVLTPQTVKGLVVYHILGARAFSVNLPPTPAPVLTLLNTAIANHPGVTVQATFGPTGVTSATVKGAGNGSASNILIDPRPNRTSDQHYINGVLHKIDQVLLPQ